MFFRLGFVLVSHSLRNGNIVWYLYALRSQKFSKGHYDYSTAASGCYFTIELCIIVSADSVFGFCYGLGLLYIFYEQMTFVLKFFCVLCATEKGQQSVCNNLHLSSQNNLFISFF